MMIRKTHILARHFYNMKDDSAGIFYTKGDVGVDKKSIITMAVTGCSFLE
jgi:hypothetical protein